MKVAAFLQHFQALSNLEQETGHENLIVLPSKGHPPAYSNVSLVKLHSPVVEGVALTPGCLGSSPYT